ncbi:hypothetical protein F4780DRAFT_777724 [Xylariomycetidae sp. FL0641]|nr:hypothetical protein F4780DRAFT_777724 [Xylariomycetidae sp. FL0641]
MSLDFGALAFRPKLLANIVPRAGMVYLGPDKVLCKGRRDKLVADALRAGGYQLTKQDLSAALVPLFRAAGPVLLQGRAEGKDLWDLLPLVQSQLAWARALPGGIFLELFARLVQARHTWAQHPTFPGFDYTRYDPLVVEIANFRKAVGDAPTNDGDADDKSWILTDLAFFDLSGGLEEDEEEVEEKEEEQAHGGDAMEIDG